MNKEALRILSEEYMKIGGRVFADYFLRLKSSDEQKKSLEAMDFMKGLMEGNIKKEWKLEDSEDYIKLLDLANTINQLNG